MVILAQPLQIAAMVVGRKGVFHVLEQAIAQVDISMLFVMGILVIASKNELDICMRLRLKVRLLFIFLY